VEREEVVEPGRGTGGGSGAVASRSLAEGLRIREEVRRDMVAVLMEGEGLVSAGVDGVHGC